MPQRKQIKPDEKVGLKLTIAERKLILNDLIGVDQEYIQTIQDTPPGKPIHFTLNDLDNLSGCIAAEANHTTDKRLEKKLDRVFEKFQGLLDQYTDEEPAPALRVFSPPDDADGEKAVKIAEFAAGILATGRTSSGFLPEAILEALRLWQRRWTFSDITLQTAVRDGRCECVSGKEFCLPGACKELRAMCDGSPTPHGPG